MAKNGGTASIFTSQGESIAFSGEACTRVGLTEEFYIADRDKSWWDPDPAKPVAFTIGGNPATPITIDYAAGMVTFAAYSSGTVLASGYYFEPEWLGGGFGFDIQPKGDKKEVTTFPTTLDTKVQWKKWMATLKDWTATIERHYWYGRAWKLMDCTNDQADLIWVLRDYGSSGNLKKIEYVVSGTETPLDVDYVDGTITVTVETDVLGDPVSLASEIKDFVDGDETLSALVEVLYRDEAVPASVTMNCVPEDSDLIWSWRVGGEVGEAESVNYIISGNSTPLSVSYASHTITVHVETDQYGDPVSTAADIKAYVDTHYDLWSIVDTSFPCGQTGEGIVEDIGPLSMTGGEDAGSGVVEALAEVNFSSGRDYASDIARLGQNILVRFYLDVQTATLEILSGVGMIEDVSLDVKLDDVINAPLTIQGIGRLKYHSV